MTSRVEYPPIHYVIRKESPAFCNVVGWINGTDDPRQVTCPKCKARLQQVGLRA